MMGQQQQGSPLQRRTAFLDKAQHTQMQNRMAAAAEGATVTQLHRPRGSVWS